MSSFIEDLWSSVFTPGPTPTLLVATNATFAALQLVLLLLFVATYSIHFVVLSILSAGLWWSINWFAHEIQATQAHEEEKKQQQQERAGDAKSAGAFENADSDTETEGVPKQARKSKTTESTASASKSTANTSSSLSPADESLRKRTSQGGDSSGYVSTDSEWEKVEDEKSS